MSSAAGGRYTLHMWQGVDEIVPCVPILCESFYVKIRVCYCVEFPNNDLKVVNSFTKSFFRRRPAFLTEESLKTGLRCHLVPAPFPDDFEDAIVSKALSFAHRMANDPCNDRREVLPMMVEVKIRTQPGNCADEIPWALRESPTQEDCLFSSVNAVKPSIEALEMVMLGDSCPIEQQCAICLAKLAVGGAGPEICSTPCSHIYHVDCITQWLRTSNVCPSCRFYMPT